MCPSAPRVCSEPGGQKPVLSLSLDLIGKVEHRYTPYFAFPLNTPYLTLTHWGRVTHICINELTKHGQCQAIIWTSVGIFLIGPFGTNGEILIEIYTLSFNKIHWKMVAILSQPQCVNGWVMGCLLWEPWRKLTGVRGAHWITHGSFYECAQPMRLHIAL